MKNEKRDCAQDIMEEGDLFVPFWVEQVAAAEGGNERDGNR